ncbi:MAG: class II glutamine amidotransferase [Candidatus Micrarchaeota archaeon]
MCRLFGNITKEAVCINFSFFRALKPFRSLVKTNRDGWGIGWYKKGRARLFREGLEKVHNNINKYHFSKVKTVVSNIIISHVRDAIWGDNRTVNSQPIKYKNWLFAHNGDIHRTKAVAHLNNKYKKAVKGETDSEVYFMLLMQNLERSGKLEEAVEKTVAIIKKYPATAMNFLLSDGKNLYAYRDYVARKRKHTLYYLVRDLAHNKPMKHASRKTRQLLRSPHLHRKRTVLFCSEKLTDENWLPIKKGMLIKTGKDLHVELININRSR